MNNYGNGPKSDIEQTVLGNIITGYTKKDLEVPIKEKAILEELAYKVKKIASSVEQKEKIKLWNDHNMLKRTRPVIFCDPENGWNKIVTSKQMICKNKIARVWEMRLRKEIFWGQEMGDDRPVADFFDVTITTEPDDWSVGTVYQHGHTKEDSYQSGSYVWEPPIKDYSRDLKKIRFNDPVIN